MRQLSRFIALALLLILFALPALAEEDAPIVMTANLGYDGAVMLTREMPAVVTLENHGVEIVGTLAVNVFVTKTSYNRYEIPVTLPQGAVKRFSLPVRPQSRQPEYTFELLSGGKVIAEATVTPKSLVSPETVFIGTLSHDPQALSYMNIVSGANPSLRSESWLLSALDEESFPETAQALSCFTMLVVDGFDCALLSDAQKAALGEWLQSGGFIIVGGGTQAATNYPFFEQYTGLRAGALEEKAGVTEALAEYASLRDKPVEGALYVNAVEGFGESNVLMETDAPLAFIHAVGDGRVFTTAFDLGTRPFTGWAGANALWQRIFLRADPDRYVARVEAQSIDDSYDSARYSAESALTQMPIDGDGNGTLYLLLLALYFGVTGIGSYLILKKLDRREWMWLTVPVLAMVGVLCFVLLGEASVINDPAATSVTRVSFEDGVMRMTTYLGVSTADERERQVHVKGNAVLTPLTDDYYYDYYDYEENIGFTPKTLRNRFMLGDAMTLGFPDVASWKASYMRIDAAPPDIGSASAELWIEADGVHGIARNDTLLPLRDCGVITSFGFCTLGDMLPGEEKTFTLLVPTDEQLKTTDPEARTPILDGYMISGLSASASLSNTRAYDTYDVLNAFVYPESYLPDAQNNRQTFTWEERTQKQVRSQLLSICNDSWFERGVRLSLVYRFVGFSDTIGRPEAELNGEPITRTEHVAVVDVAAEYRPIGQTGEVYYPRGFVLPQEAGVNDEGIPHVVTDAEGLPILRDNYIDLSEGPVTLCFPLPDVTSINIHSMSLLPGYTDARPITTLYNNKTGEWDEQASAFIMLEGETCNDYFDKEGRLFVRYRMDDNETNRYGGMEAPGLEVKGQVK